MLTHTKFFIGLDETVVNAINKQRVQILEQYRSEYIYEESTNNYILLDYDGVLINKAKDGCDHQLERLFNDEAVEKRLGLYTSYLRGETHKCGAHCKSPSIEGKSCEIHTYRELCHWHR
ncbi:hypothetical protein [Arcticibacter tournemirensis]